jgi:hypothetical protein
VNFNVKWRKFGVYWRVRERYFPTEETQARPVSEQLQKHPITAFYRYLPLAFFS